MKPWTHQRECISIITFDSNRCGYYSRLREYLSPRMPKLSRPGKVRCALLSARLLGYRHFTLDTLRELK